MRLTIAVPEDHISAANQLMVAIGNPADVNTFTPPRYRIGNMPVSVASGQIDYEALTTAAVTGAAKAAQDLIGTEITVSHLDDPQEALADLGCEPIDEMDEVDD